MILLVKDALKASLLDLCHRHLPRIKVSCSCILTLYIVAIDSLCASNAHMLTTSLTSHVGVQRESVENVWVIMSELLIVLTMSRVGVQCESVENVWVIKSKLLTVLTTTSIFLLLHPWVCSGSSLGSIRHSVIQ
jgi:hypothetical protein